MATDLEIKSEEGQLPPARPSLKIVGLHIKGLKSIGSLDLPEDGLGWNGEIPDFLMVGGINGSGKTTFLDFVAQAFDCLPQSLDSHGIQDLPNQLRAVEARIDLRFSISTGFNEEFRFLFGDKKFLEKNGEGTWFGFECISTLPPHRGLFRQHGQSRAISGLVSSLFRSWDEERYQSPSLVYFPSEGRNLVVPETTYKTPGNLMPSGRLVHRWERPEDWKDSLPARLYALRWEDLNAKEEGRPEDATHFRAYQLAFDRFFEGRKQIRWTPKGELVVETKSGVIHDLSELSSGEKQVILFMGELLYRWRPGSLILIDEPELHLHESYQTKLWEALVDWQKERGGQVILATQSAHLFGLSGLGSRVILNSRRSR